MAIVWMPRSSPRRHDPTSDHRHHRLDVLDLIRGDREVVAVHHDEIGQASCLDRTEVVLLEDEERVPSRVRDEGILATDRLSNTPAPPTILPVTAHASVVKGRI